jgi:hypothetical protein
MEGIKERARSNIMAHLGEMSRSQENGHQKMYKNQTTLVYDQVTKKRVNWLKTEAIAAKSTVGHTPVGCCHM